MTKRPHIARPCTARGTVLSPRGDGTYFCPSCEEVVHDLRNVPRSEASRRFHANGGRLCGIVRAWPDGELRFAPEPPRKGIGAAAGGVALALAVTGCDDPTPAEVPETIVEEPPAEAPPPVPMPEEPDPVVAQEAEPLVEQEEPASDEPAVAANTDDSPHRHHHEAHAHEHEPVVVDDGMLGGGLDGL